MTKVMTGDDSDQNDDMVLNEKTKMKVKGDGDAKVMIVKSGDVVLTARRRVGVEWQWW